MQDTWVKPLRHSWSKSSPRNSQSQISRRPVKHSAPQHRGGPPRLVDVLFLSEMSFGNMGSSVTKDRATPSGRCAILIRQRGPKGDLNATLPEAEHYYLHSAL